VSVGFIVNIYVIAYFDIYVYVIICVCIFVCICFLLLFLCLRGQKRYLIQSDIHMLSHVTFTRYLSDIHTLSHTE